MFKDNITYVEKKKKKKRRRRRSLKVCNANPSLELDIRVTETASLSHPSH
jgi:hypothetical protein